MCAAHFSTIWKFLLSKESLSPVRPTYPDPVLNIEMHCIENPIKIFEIYILQDKKDNQQFFLYHDSDIADTFANANKYICHIENICANTNISWDYHFKSNIAKHFFSTFHNMKNLFYSMKTNYCQT